MIILQDSNADVDFAASRGSPFGMDTMQELVDIMRAGRVLAGMSQSDLAASAGLSRQMIARMENRADNITVGALSAVRGALERAGVVFIPSTPTRGPGVALARRSD